jgi:hypothetical protein
MIFLALKHHAYQCYEQFVNEFVYQKQETIYLNKYGCVMVINLRILAVTVGILNQFRSYEICDRESDKRAGFFWAYLAQPHFTVCSMTVTHSTMWNCIFSVQAASLSNKFQHVATFQRYFKSPGKSLKFILEDGSRDSEIKNRTS